MAAGTAQAEVDADAADLVHGVGIARFGDGIVVGVPEYVAVGILLPDSVAAGVGLDDLVVLAADGAALAGLELVGGQDNYVFFNSQIAPNDAARSKKYAP